MPSGESPEHAQQYYQYLQAHKETMQRADTWHVQWIQLAWLWGFVIALVVVLLLWIWQYRSTRQKAGPYPVDSFGGYTTELAGPATLFGAGNSVNLNNQDSGDRSNTTTIDIEVAESTATPTVTPIPATRTARPTTGPLPCVGDCDGNGSVAIGELITGVNISLGSRPLTDCADFDANDSGAIEVNELVSAVNGALLGCVP
jgi:hypothetical protein